MVTTNYLVSKLPMNFFIIISVDSGSFLQCVNDPCKRLYFCGKNTRLTNCIVDNVDIAICLAHFLLVRGYDQPEFLMVEIVTIREGRPEARNTDIIVAFIVVCTHWTQWVTWLSFPLVEVARTALANELV